jgi:ABC-2 type transport system permease protein
MIQIVSVIGKNFENLKYFTMCSLFHGKEIASGTYRILPVIALFFIGTIFYSIGMYIFKKKDLPL